MSDLRPVVGSEQGGIRPVLIDPERYREQTQPDSDLCCHYFQDE